MSKLSEIQSEILRLQKEAAKIRAQEFKRTVVDIRQKMQEFGITARDLEKSTTRPKKKSAEKPAQKVKSSPNTKKRVALAPKYKGPNGETWSGRGLTPKWLNLLLAQGRAKDSFLIGAEISDN